MLLSGKRLKPLPSKKYVNDIGNAVNEILQITYLWARKETNADLLKQLPKSEQEKLQFLEIADIANIDNSNIDTVIGELYKNQEAIDDLINQLNLEKGSIYLTRLNVEDLLLKSKQIAILSYSDYVTKVNNKLAIAIQTGQPYKQFISLIKEGNAQGLSLFNLVDNKSYWDTVFRTNMSTNFHAGYLDQVAELEEFIAYETYNSINAEHEQCAALTGVTRPVGEFEANGNSIPADYNCTAFFTITSKITASANNIKPTKNWDSGARPDRGFGGKTTAKKTSILPKTVTNRLPGNWQSVI